MASYLTDGAGTNIGSAPPTHSVIPNDASGYGGMNVYNPAVDAAKPVAKTSSPTVISDTNIRDKVIPEIQNKASTMLDYEKNPYYIRPGETMDAYKARTGIAAALEGNDKQQGTQSGDVPENEYDSIYESVMGSKPAEDNFYDADLELLKQMQKTSDARTSNTLAGISDQFQRTRADASRMQAGNQASTRAALLRSGASRYAPTNAASTMSAQQRGYIRQLSDIDLKESQAKNEALAAQEDNDYKLLGAKLDILGEKRKEKLDVVNKMYDTIIKQKEQTQQDITKLVTDAAKNGAPSTITNSMAAAQSVGEAMEMAGDYLQTASGTPGEYLYYKRDAIAHGQVPMSYNDYADMDANRKRSIVNVNSGGLSTVESNQFLRITDKYQADPIIMASDKGKTAGIIADQVIADPGNATNQLKALYVLVKNLDPDSAVREGETALAQKTQSYLQTFKTAFTRLDKGQIVAPETATALATATKELASAWDSSAQVRTKRYKSQAHNANPKVGEAFDSYITDYSEDIIDPIQQESQAETEVTSYAQQNPDQAEMIRGLMAGVNEKTGQPYTSIEIKQIVGI